MLIKMICSRPGDFEKSLKLRRGMALGFLAVGLIGLACYFLLVPGSGLTDYAQGFYLGAASGIILGALILFCRTQYLLTHPDKRKAVQVKEQDEREITINNMAFRAAGLATFFLSAGALFVVLPLSYTAFCVLLAVMVLYFMFFLAAAAWYSRKL